MRSSEVGHRNVLCGGLAVALLALLLAMRAEAQQTQGFALERFYPSPAGGGWFVMDAIDWQPAFGGAIELSSGYARNPLELPSGAQHLAVVSDEAFVDVAVAATYDRYRLSLNLTSPLSVIGQSGTVAGYQFTAPSFDLGKNPDTISDARIGLDVRLLGAPAGRFRLGASAQLFIPSGARSDDLSDGTFRGMLRVLVAGDVGCWRYGAQLGVHLRPLDELPAPESPAGSELLFGVAAGPRLSLGSRWALVLGPELFGETALRSFLGNQTTGVEGLLSGRLEGTGSGPQLRIKLGAGGGLDPQFGAPAARVLLAVELFSQALEAPVP